MKFFLKVAQIIDAINRLFGTLATWLVLIATLISAGNASTRYLFDMSSNAWLEIQWYMFAGMVMLGASYTLKVNEHVRVDVIYGRLSPRNCALVDLFGLLVFLMPATVLLSKMCWPFFYNSFISQEMSSNAGGLIIWPAKLMLALGFTMVSLQGLSEIIKRIGYLRGQFNMDTHYERPLQ